MNDLADNPVPPRRIQRNRLALGLVLTALVTGALWVAGLIWFATAAAGQPRSGDAHTDAIVVLTGGSERIATGLALLARRRADELFISGVEAGVELDDLLSEATRSAGFVDPGDLGHRIIVGYRAADTVGNAEEVAGWMHSRGYRSLRLVTANYHMPRSLLAFRRLLPGIEIHPHPVQPDRVHLDDWWRWPGTTLLLVSEYSKYMVSYLRFAVTAAAAPPTG